MASLDRAFFEKVLRRVFANEREPPQLITYQMKPVVAIGDSYTSNIKRVTLKYKHKDCEHEEDVPVIVKTQVRGSIVEEWTLELDFFATEIRMFSEVLPRLRRHLDVVLSGECYVATSQPDFTLVLEDLQPAGYVMLDRQVGFDMEHAVGVLRVLAQLHAGSVVLAERHHVPLESFSKGLFSDSRVSLAWMTRGLQSLIRTCSSLEECTAIGEKMAALGVEEAIRRGLAAAARHDDGFSVLNHGDMWCNNMLFKHDAVTGSSLVDVKLVDFQLAKFTSPALDLHYFFATSLDEDARPCRDALLDAYYSLLVGNLVRFKHALRDVPSRNNLQVDFERRAFYGVIALAAVTPLVKAPPRADACFESLDENETTGSFREFVYSTNAYKQTLIELLPYYDSLGIFD